jgi:hypothetical protein
MIIIPFDYKKVDRFKRQDMIQWVKDNNGIVKRDGPSSDWEGIQAAIGSSPLAINLPLITSIHVQTEEDALALKLKFGL